MEKRRIVKGKATHLPGFTGNEEIQGYLNEILYLIDSSKNARSEALAFDPDKLEKKSPKLTMELRKLNSDNKTTEEQITVGSI